MSHALKFPVERRPEKRSLSTAPQSEVDEWFYKSKITIGETADTPERQALA
jgi:hypothetical protein